MRLSGGQRQRLAIARAVLTDLIAVLENGRIIQTGTHTELMALGGKYRTMVEQQIYMGFGKAATTT